MASTVVTQTATYERKTHTYMLNGSLFTGYDAPPLAAKYFAQALVSLGMTITVVQDTTQEYDETLQPNRQPSQIYQAHVCDPVYNIGIYLNCGLGMHGSPYGICYRFPSGITTDGLVRRDMPCMYYSLDARPQTIIKQSFGSMVKYIFLLANTSLYNGDDSGHSESTGNTGSALGYFATLSGFKAANLFTGEEESFGTYGAADNNYWFIGTTYNTVNYAATSSTGHTSGLPQPNGEKTLLWQSPLQCSAMLYDKINGGRLFSCSGSSNSLPVGADFTVDGVTLRALDTKYALELT